jgi:arabinose-5-phosphate isomerase
MTPKPITVRVDKLAVEVLNLFEAHRIGDLIVVDRRNHPVGLVDAQDLAKVKLLSRRSMTADGKTKRSARARRS